MRISDWSSDVCSSDLAAAVAHGAQDQEVADRLRHADAHGDGLRVLPAGRVLLARLPGAHHRRATGGLDGDRKRVAWGKSVAVRVESGGRRIIKTKQQHA